MIQTGKDHLLFDGDCGICTWCSELAKRMKLTLDADWKKSIRERKSSVALN